MKCVRCGTELNENDKFCLGCGFEVGRRYERPNSAETLESIMNMPVEELEPTNQTIIDDGAEELDIDSDIKYSENIGDDVVDVSVSNVSEGEVLEKTRGKKNYWKILIVLFAIIICFGTYKLVNYIIDNFKSKTPKVPIEDVKPNINNNPTTLYSFGNNFIVKINNLWTLLDKGGSDRDSLENKYFITDGSTLTLNLYKFSSDSLNTYIKKKQIDSTYEEVEINKEKYYVFTFENNKNYVKIIDNYLYAFEFFYTENIDSLIEDIMNNVIFYN